MARQLLLSLGISLGMTLILEVLFAVVLSKRGKDLLLVCLVNVLTNPAVVLIYFIASRFTPCSPVILKAVLEIAAVLTEAIIYKTYGENFRKPLLFTIGANVFSFGAGELILWIGG